MGLRGHGQRDDPRPAARGPAQPPGRADLARRRPADDLDSALAMAGSLGLFWHLGRHLEGRELLARLLATGAGAARRPARARCRRSPWWNGRAPAWCTRVRGARRRRAESLATLRASSATRPAPPCPECCSPSRASPAPTPNGSEELLRRGRGPVPTGDGDPTGAPAVIGFVRMETALKTGDEDERHPDRPRHRCGVPAARRPLGTLGDPVPPRVGPAAVRPLRRSRPRASRKRSTSPPAPASTTPSSGRWPTSASPSSTWAT